MYHTNRKRDSFFLKDHDIVLTSYSIVRAEVRRDTHPLHDIYWHRIVLDESHYLKSLQSQGLLDELCNLHARYRWCVTGTPITTQMTDLLQQAKFLGLRLFDGKLTSRIQLGQSLWATTVRQLMMMHRASQCYLDGTPLVALPPRHTHVVYVELRGIERTLYDHVFGEAKKDLQVLLQGGAQLAARFYTRIVSSSLLPCRMLLAHPAVCTPLMLESFGLTLGTNKPQLLATIDNDDDDAANDSQPPVIFVVLVCVVCSLLTNEKIIIVETSKSCSFCKSKGFCSGRRR
jgi:hypothetical protein